VGNCTSSSAKELSLALQARGPYYTDIVRRRYWCTPSDLVRYTKPVHLSGEGQYHARTFQGPHMADDVVAEQKDGPHQPLPPLDVGGEHLWSPDT
jgi:hypothetical protein